MIWFVWVIHECIWNILNYPHTHTKHSNIKSTWRFASIFRQSYISFGHADKLFPERMHLRACKAFISYGVSKLWTSSKTTWIKQSYMDYETWQRRGIELKKILWRPCLQISSVLMGCKQLIVFFHIFKFKCQKLYEACGKVILTIRYRTLYGFWVCWFFCGNICRSVCIIELLN